MVQLFIPGAEPLEPLGTDENGRVTADGVIIHTTAQKIVIEAQAVGFATRGRKPITLPRPESKKAKKVARLVTLNTVVESENLIVTLARVDEADEGKAGKICFLEGGATQTKTIDSDEFGVTILSFPLQERKRKVTIFLPEKPEQKIEPEIPAKKVITSEQEPESEPKKQKKSFADIWREGYRRGRQE